VRPRGASNTRGEARVIADPVERGRALARFFAEIAPRLLSDLEEARLVPAADAGRVAREWECLALYACVRGLIAAGGFNRETAVAIDALHDEVFGGDSETGDEGIEARRARAAERYAEYGAIGQAAERDGAAALASRIGAAAAAHLCDGKAPDELAETIGGLHEALAEGAAESVRRRDADEGKR
jgi:hypothetical protein